MTETAVVILNYNGRNFLRQFLPIIIQYSSNARIIVADNASTDDSIQIIESFADQVEMIKMDRNRGYCGGYNYALRKIEADYFVLLNSDIEVTEGWIEPIIDLFKSDPAIAAAQPKILAFNDKHKFEYAGAAGGYIDLLGYPFCRGRIFSHVEEDHGQYDDTRQVFWATGACLFIRSQVFKNSGGFDEDFFAHMEEIDLCWRLNQQGYKIYFSGKSKVYHIGGGTLSSSNPMKTHFNFRNGLSLIIKHLPTSELLWKLPVRVALDWLAALFFMINGKPADAKAVLTAHIAFLRNLKSDIRKRNNTPKRDLKRKITGIYRWPLPFQYFIRGKKTFGSL